VVLCTVVLLISRGFRNYDTCLRIFYTVLLPVESIFRNLQKGAPPDPAFLSRARKPDVFLKPTLLRNQQSKFDDDENSNSTLSFQQHLTKSKSQQTLTTRIHLFIKITMNHYKISLALIAMTAGSHAFTISPSNKIASTRLASTRANDLFFMDEIPSDQPNQALSHTIEPSQPVAPKKKPSPKKGGAAHGKEGVLSPVVTTLKAVVGEEELNKVRGKVIAMHSDVIKGFVDTADSPIGQTVLKTMFAVADVDKNGTLEENELNQALETLGFRFLNEKQMHGIFERADTDKDGHIDLDEWMEEAPKTLRTNLVKLAKKNGGDLGLLA
jgi:hypothetical protein